ncbi:MAG: insulinase family protein [Kofleriaceae bacterium]|nr:insulinase family protein [Kofleriaceae bacterium]
MLVAAACGAVLKPPEPNRRLDVRMAGDLFDSDRGYRFAALPHARANVVRLDVRYPVGSADDPPGKEGLAHLVEHLLFEVQFARGESKTSIAAELGRISIGWNAYTTPEYTTYVVTAPANALEDLLRLEVDRVSVGCAGLTPEIVAREREVVLNELRERQGASGAALQRQIYEAVYPENHAYRRVDSVETVAKLELKDVCDFLAGPYLRGPAIVIASGQVDGEGLKAAAGKHFGRLRKRQPSVRPQPAPPPPQPGLQRIKGDVDEPTLVALWPMPDASTPGYRLLEMVWPSIPYRMNAFGFTYEWGHGATWDTLGGPRAPVLSLRMTLQSASKLGDAKDALEKSIAFAIRTMGENRESREWVASWEGEVESLLAGWDTLGRRNELFGDYLQFEAPGAFLPDRLTELASAGPQSAKQLAEEWLSLSRARLILIEPSGTSGTLPALTYHGGAEAHATKVDGALADQPLPAPARMPPLVVERYTLENGLTVVLWPHGDAPVVHGRLIIDSGSGHDPRGREGTASLVGADDEGVDALVFNGRNLATRVDDLVRTLAWELRSPGYGLSDEQKAFLAGRLKQQRAQERMAYNLELLGALYGKTHPYARASLTEKSLDNISHDTVMSWARGHLVAKNATLVIAGSFDPDVVKKHIAYNADQVAGGSDSPDLTQLGTTQVAFVPGVTTKDMATVELAAHFVGGEGIDGEYAFRLVLEQLLDQRLSSLRGKQALTYGFSASYDPRVGGGLWTIGGAADATRSGEAAASLIKILDELRRDPESYRADFVLARQKVLESLLMQNTSSASVANRLELLARFELRDDFYDTLARTVSQLTLPRMASFIKSELPANGQVIGAFGNEREVRTALSRAQAATNETRR